MRRGAPRKIGSAEHAIEESLIQRVEDFVQIVEMPSGSGVALATASVADEFSLARDGGAGGESLEADVVRRIDGLLVQLGQEDVGDSANDALRGTLDQVRKADEDFAFTQANGGIQRCESTKANRDRRDRRPGA